MSTVEDNETNSAADSVTVSQLYRDFASAQDAITRLQDAGIAEDAISVLANNSEKWFSPEFGTAAAKGAAFGAGIGGFGGLLAGLGLLAIPGFGPVVAAGWLAATAAGAASVAAAGGAIGVLAEAGVATNEAETYAESIRCGGSLVSVRVPSAERDRVVALLSPPAAAKPKGQSPVTA